ncbi:hypothetical protein P8C59_004439 [Phyllachora maydis]|uniref:Uncharacterized protein n=1 Tax=Phyllachora maydis TaxID=1825666 RepID=A0AAD9I3E5_9PEZI|nr:hypothetical protein P8C59_004439 [Phyllachora maydis]
MRVCHLALMGLTVHSPLYEARIEQQTQWGSQFAVLSKVLRDSMQAAFHRTILLPPSPFCTRPLAQNSPPLYHRS